MSSFEFEWHGSGSLASQLTAGIVRVTVKSAAHGRPIAITLWRLDGTGLRIQSLMRDLAKRTEIGVLDLSLVQSADDGEDGFELPPSFKQPVKTTKLVIRESGSTAESGLAIEASDGQQIVITAGAFPYTLAVEGFVSMPHAFEPEYPLAKYDRVAVV